MMWVTRFLKARSAYPRASARIRIGLNYGTYYASLLTLSFRGSKASQVARGGRARRMPRQTRAAPQQESNIDLSSTHAREPRPRQRTKKAMRCARREGTSQSIC